MGLKYSANKSRRVLLIGSGAVLMAVLCVYLPGWMTSYVRATILEYQKHVLADQLFYLANDGDKKAIAELESLHSRYANQLLRKLFYDQSSSADRRSVALALKSNGAIECVWAAMNLLHNLRAGGQTAYEKSVSRETHLPEARQYAIEDHDEAEEACKKLLLSNPCETLRVLSTKNDSQFASDLKAKLGGQQACR